MHFEATGQMPRRLSDLLDQDLVPESFVCPAGPQTPLTREQFRTSPWMLDDPTWSSYTFLPLTTDQRSAENVQAFDTFEHRGMRGINVLFGDGHVEWLGRGEAVRVLRAEYAAGVRPLRVRHIPASTGPTRARRDQP
jgi:prepilin-type processing-associated H-X9-DG protein